MRIIQNQINKRKIKYLSLVFLLIGLLTFAISFAVNRYVPAMALAKDSKLYITLSQIAEGLNRPVSLTNTNDSSGRLFIVEHRGRITIMNNNILPNPFLKIEDRIKSPGTSGGNEQGLLGLAFPPGFSEKRYFYVYYTMLSGDNGVARFSVSDNLIAADPASEEQILALPHPTYTNHNGGQLNFGPDGFISALVMAAACYPYNCEY